MGVDLDPASVAQVVDQAGKLQPLSPDKDVITDTQTHDDGAFRYVTETHPDKGRSSRELDTRASKMWTRWLGAHKDLSKLTPSEWRGFIRARTSGEIDAHGKPVPEKDAEGKPLRKPIRPRTVENDCEWLVWVLTWATKERDGDGRPLVCAQVT